jgi:hypothetical protein
LAATGVEVPALQSRPPEAGMQLYLLGFAELTTCRQIGMGVGPIPWTAIQKYIEVSEFDDEEAYEFHEIIRHMDYIWLKLNRERQDREAQAAKSGGPPTTKPATPAGGRRAKR